jgi:hypothetical protein
LRAITKNQRNLESAVMMSSLMPSEKSAWSHFASGYKWAWHAQVNLDFGALLDTLKQAVDTAFTAAAIIL